MNNKQMKKFTVYASKEKGWNGWYGVSVTGEETPDVSFCLVTYSGGAMRDGISDFGSTALKECRAAARTNAQRIASALNAAEKKGD